MWQDKGQNHNRVDATEKLDGKRRKAANLLPHPNKAQKQEKQKILQADLEYINQNNWV